jgi:hypothetical protein
MTTKNFQYAMQDADTNGNLDIDEVVGVKVQSSLDTIDDIKITGACKREEILPVLENYTFIIFYDKFGNGYSRIIY